MSSDHRKCEKKNERCVGVLCVIGWADIATLLFRERARDILTAVAFHSTTRKEGKSPALPYLSVCWWMCRGAWP